MELLRQPFQRHIHVMPLDIIHNLDDAFLPAFHAVLRQGQLVGGGYQRRNGAFDDVLINPRAPVHPALVGKSHIGRRLGGRPAGNGMLLINGKFIADAKITLNGVADRIQTPVAAGVYHAADAVLLNRHFRLNAVHLPEMTFRHRKHIAAVDVLILENLMDFRRGQLLVPFIGDALNQIPHFFLHPIRQIDPEVLLQNKGHAALAGLAVDADDVGLVLASHIPGVDGKIGHFPAFFALSFFPPGHALGDRVLMGTGKGRKNQISRIGRALMHTHPGKALVHLPDPAHIVEIQPGLHSVTDHIHGHRHQIHVPGALAVAKQRPFYAVRPRQHAELRVADAAAPVIVGMDAQNHRVPVFHIFMQIFHLAGKHMGHGNLHRGGNIDDGLSLCRGLPDIQHRIANLQRILHLCARETLRTVFKGEIALHLRRDLRQQPGAVYGQLFHFFLALFKHLLPLCHRGGIVKMNDGPGRSLDRFKGLADDVIPGLGQHLDGHILRDHISFDQRAYKLIFRVGGRRKSHFDLLKAHFHKEIEKLQLLLQTHGLDQRLIAVPQVHAAPDRRLCNGILLHPVVGDHRGHKIRFSVFFFHVHGIFSFSFPITSLQLTKKCLHENSPRRRFHRDAKSSCAVPLYFMAVPCAHRHGPHKRAGCLFPFHGGNSVCAYTTGNAQQNPPAFGQPLRGQFPFRL